MTQMCSALFHKAKPLAVWLQGCMQEHLKSEDHLSFPNSYFLWFTFVSYCGCQEPQGSGHKAEVKLAHPPELMAVTWRSRSPARTGLSKKYLAKALLQKQCLGHQRQGEAGAGTVIFLGVSDSMNTDQLAQFLPSRSNLLMRYDGVCLIQSTQALSQCREHLQSNILVCAQ